MSFTDDLWQQIKPVYDAILDHPFLNQMADGTLSRERFVFYMKQDSLYLQEFSKALATAGARAPDVDSMLFFVNSAHTCAVVERALHEGYFKDFGVTLDVGRAPSNFAYSSYLLATASNSSYRVAIAALLPCFWIYREVGDELVKRASAGLAGNPYAKWIETYSSEEFSTSVDKAIRLVDNAAAEANDVERAEMAQAFDYASRMEWTFWDAAWRLETWPPYEVRA
jgi:thiaminase (transcriptional activator TenA)